MYPNLKLRLWSTGMKQNRLAQMIGMDETMLSKGINGFREITPEVRRKIATLLHAEESWLFDRVAAAESEEVSPRREAN